MYDKDDGDDNRQKNKDNEHEREDNEDSYHDHNNNGQDNDQTDGSSFEDNANARVHSRPPSLQPYSGSL